MTTAYIIENRILLTKEFDDRSKIAQRLMGMLQHSFHPSRSELFTMSGYIETLLLRNKGLQHAARYNEEDEGLTWDRIQSRLGTSVQRLVVVDTGLENGVYSKHMHVTVLSPAEGMKCQWHMELGALLMLEAHHFAENGLSPMFIFEIAAWRQEPKRVLHIHKSHFDDLQKFAWKLWKEHHDRPAHQMAMLMDRMVEWRDQSMSRTDEERAELLRQAAIERAGPRSPLMIAA